MSAIRRPARRLSDDDVIPQGDGRPVRALMLFGAAVQAAVQAEVKEMAKGVAKGAAKEVAVRVA